MVWARVNATIPTYTWFLAPVEDYVVAGEDNVRSILRPPRGRGSRDATGSRGGAVTIPATATIDNIAVTETLSIDRAHDLQITCFTNNEIIFQVIISIVLVFL